MSKTTASKKTNTLLETPIDQLKENANSTLSEAKQLTTEAIKRLEAQASAATEAVQKNVENLQTEVGNRLHVAKEQVSDTKENVAELFSTLKDEVTQTFNELLNDVQGTYAEVKDVLLKAKGDALVKLENSKKTTLDALQKFKP